MHYAHAPVLQAQPAIQTVQAKHAHEYCPPAPASRPLSILLAKKPQAPGLLQHLRMLITDLEPAADAISPEPAIHSDTTTIVSQYCQHIEAGAHYQRVVAWDVDYIYQGKQYRSRLPLDTGSCVRLRVSITPLLEAELPMDTLPR